jgi:hypothetical protein
MGPTRSALARNADGCKARDEGRRSNYEAEERAAADAALSRRAGGTGLAGAPALSPGSPIAPTIGFARLLAIPPGKPPSRPCGTRSEAP